METDTQCQFLVNRIRVLVSYRRILVFTDKSVRTLNPDSYSITNEFAYQHIQSVKVGVDRFSFVIETLHPNTKKSMYYDYSSENFRCEILTRLNECLYCYRSQLYDDMHTNLLHKGTKPPTDGPLLLEYDRSTENSSNNNNKDHKDGVGIGVDGEGGEDDIRIGDISFSESSYYKAKRVTKAGKQVHTLLTVRSYGIVEVEEYMNEKRELRCYHFHRLSSISTLKDTPVIYFTSQNRMKIFKLEVGMELQLLYSEIQEKMALVGASCLFTNDENTPTAINGNTSTAGSTNTSGVDKENDANSTRSKLPPHMKNKSSTLARKILSLTDIITQRNDIAASVIGSGPISTFEITKFSSRHTRPVARQLQINEEYLVEKDSAGFVTHSYRRLTSIFCIVRHSNNNREYTIESDDGSDRRYACSQRDELLTVILDICHAVGNNRVMVRSESSNALRLLPRNVSSEVYSQALQGGVAGGSNIHDFFFGSNSLETCLMIRLHKMLAIHIQALTAVPGGQGPHRAPGGGVGIGAKAIEESARVAICGVCMEFNSNIGFPGISVDSRADLVKAVMLYLLQGINSELLKTSTSSNTSNAANQGDGNTKEVDSSEEGGPVDVSEKQSNIRCLIIMLQTLCRIIPCVHGYKAFCELNTINSRLILLQLLIIDNTFINYWALEVLKMLCNCPYSPRNVKQEYVNKRTLLTDQMLECILHLVSETPSDETNTTTAISTDDTTRVAPSRSGSVTLPGGEGEGSEARRSESVDRTTMVDHQNRELSGEAMNSPVRHLLTPLRSPLPASRSPIRNHTPTRVASISTIATTPTRTPTGPTRTPVGPQKRQNFEHDIPPELIPTRTFSRTFGPSPLLLMNVASLLEAILSGRRDTSSPELVALVLKKLGKRCELLLLMLRNISFVVLENAAILMYILLKHHPSVAPSLKEIALSEGLAIKHFYNAVFSPSSTQRYISRFLVSTWMSGDDMLGDMGKALLCRILPQGLVAFLKAPSLTLAQRQYLDEMEEEYYDSNTNTKKVSPIGNTAATARSLNNGAELQKRLRMRIAKVLKEVIPKDDQLMEGSSRDESIMSHVGGYGNQPNMLDESFLSHSEGNTTFSAMTHKHTTGAHLGRDLYSASSTSFDTNKDTGSTRVRSNPFSTENWRMFFYMIIQNHRIPDLIWNEQTRLELRSELENELRNYEREKRLKGSDEVAWNFQQFSISYHSLQNELRVGHIYVRHFLEADDAFLRAIERPTHCELFEMLFRRVVGNLYSNIELSVLCCRCLIRLYATCYDLIGPFDDTLLTVNMLEQATNMELQHCILELLDQLSRFEANLHQLISREFVDTILQYASLAHLNPDQIGNLFARERDRSNIKMIENIDRFDEKQRAGDAGYAGYKRDGVDEESVDDEDEEGTWRESKVYGRSHSPYKPIDSDDSSDDSLDLMNFDASAMEGKKKDGEHAATLHGSADGTAESPSQPSSHRAGEGRGLWTPEDAACPATWYYTSPSSSIPPPPSAQQGPLRLTELLQLYNDNTIDSTFIVAPSIESGGGDIEYEAGSDTVVDPGRHVGSHYNKMVDTGLWRPLNEYFQLRMQLCYPGRALYAPAEVSTKAIGILHRLSAVHKAFDARGLPFYPVPVSRRVMSDADQLTVLAQLILSNDSEVVDMVADLLYTLVEHNLAVNSKLYTTGVFFFTCRYTGNNYMAISRLLEITHLHQSYHMLASQIGRELRDSSKSILATMLPVAIINILITYGAERFAEVFTGEWDTPEVIWNSEFRSHVMDLVNQHLGSFPHRLKQYTMGRYEYCPIPTIHYPQLDKELYVYKYYLNNLCNESAYPGWEIDDPVLLLRDCVERWRAEMAKGVADTTISEAKQLLSVSEGSAGLDGKELRKQYRALARKYHPDRNPGGREMFEKVQAAYELLSSVAMKAEQTDLSSVLLLIKTQNLVYRRYGDNVKDQKYPAYSLLMQIAIIPEFPCSMIDLEEADSRKNMKYFISRKSMGFGREGDTSSDLIGKNGASAYLLYECAMLMYHTCTISPLNAREMVRTRAIERLYEITSFAMRGIERCRAAASAWDTDPLKRNKGRAVYASEADKERQSSYLLFSVCSKILVHSVKALAALALTEEGRKGIAEMCPYFAQTVYLLLRMNESLPLVCENSIILISRCCTDSSLQRAFVDAGCFWLLIPLLLAFDGTMEVANKQAKQHHRRSIDRGDNCGHSSPEKSISNEYDEDDEGDVDPSHHPSAGYDEDQREVHNQNSCNMHAILSAQALGRIGSYMYNDLASPAYPEVHTALDTLLTPSIAKLLRHARPWELLQTLNRTLETPTKIWNPGMRNELLQFVTTIINVREQRDSELSDHLQIQQAIYLNEKRRLADESVTIESTHGSDNLLTQVGSFSYTCLKEELYIGQVYVRIFNRLNGSTEGIDDPSHYIHELLSFLCSITEQGCDPNSAPHSSGEGFNDEYDDKQITMYMEENDNKEREVKYRHLDLVVCALKILVENVDYACEDLTAYPRGICALFGMLGDKLSNIKALQPSVVTTLKLIGQLAQHGPFVMVASSVYFYPDYYCVNQMLYSITQNANEHTIAHAWSMVNQFTSIREGLDAFLSQGIVLRLLGCLFGLRGFSSSYNNRDASASLLAKLLRHPSCGNETASSLKQFLPIPVVRVLRNQASMMAIDGNNGTNSSSGSGSTGSAAINLLDSNVETPELIWTKDMKSELRDVLGRVLQTSLSTQMGWEGAFPPSSGGSPEAGVAPAPEGSAVVGRHLPSAAKVVPPIPRSYQHLYTSLSREISVGNVYLKHFLKQPTYRLSNPLYTLEKVVELWEAVFARLVPRQKTSYSLRSSLLSLTGAMLPFLKSSLEGVATEVGYVEGPDQHAQLEDRRRSSSRSRSSGDKGRRSEGREGRRKSAHVVQFDSHSSDVSMSRETSSTHGNVGNDLQLGEHERSTIVIPDTQLLLLLTQAVGCILRSDASTLNHLMQWGLSNSLAKCIRRCVDQQRKVNATESSQHEKGRKRRTGLSAVSICITCSVDLLNLMVTRVDVVDELASVSENILLCLRHALENGGESGVSRGGTDSQASSLSPGVGLRGLSPTPESHWNDPGAHHRVGLLPSYTSAVLKLLIRIFQSDLSMNLLYFVQAAIQCELPQYLLHSIICAPIAAFEEMNIQIGGQSSLTSNKHAQVVRLQAADVIKAILHADDEEHYTISLRILLDNHPAWKDFGYQSHGLYGIADTSIEPLLMINGEGEVGQIGNGDNSNGADNASAETNLSSITSPISSTSNKSCSSDQTKGFPASPPLAAMSAASPPNEDDDDNKQGDKKGAGFATRSDLTNYQRLSSRGGGENKGPVGTPGDSPGFVSPNLSPIKSKVAVGSEEGDENNPFGNPFDEEADDVDSVDAPELHRSSPHRTTGSLGGMETHHENKDQVDNKNDDVLAHRPPSLSDRMTSFDDTTEHTDPGRSGSIRGRSLSAQQVDANGAVATTRGSQSHRSGSTSHHPARDRKDSEKERTGRRSTWSTRNGGSDSDSSSSEDSFLFSDIEEEDENSSDNDLEDVEREALSSIDLRAYQTFMDKEMELITERDRGDRASMAREAVVLTQQSNSGSPSRVPSRTSSHSSNLNLGIPLPGQTNTMGGGHKSSDSIGNVSASSAVSAQSHTSNHESPNSVNSMNTWLNPFGAPQTGASIGGSSRQTSLSISSTTSGHTSGVVDRAANYGIERFVTVLEKGPYGIGLDLAKSSDGGTVFLQYKDLDTGVRNLAREAVPTLQRGDRVVRVEGKGYTVFAETVKALRLSTGNSVTLEIEREK